MRKLPSENICLFTLYFHFISVKHQSRKEVVPLLDSFYLRAKRPLHSMSNRISQRLLQDRKSIRIQYAVETNNFFSFMHVYCLTGKLNIHELQRASNRSLFINHIYNDLYFSKTLQVCVKPRNRKMCSLKWTTIYLCLNRITIDYVLGLPQRKQCKFKVLVSQNLHQGTSSDKIIGRSEISIPFAKPMSIHWTQSSFSFP